MRYLSGRVLQRTGHCVELGAHCVVFLFQSLLCLEFVLPELQRFLEGRFVPVGKVPVAVRTMDVLMNGSRTPSSCTPLTDWDTTHNQVQFRFLNSCNVLSLCQIIRVTRSSEWVVEDGAPQSLNQPHKVPTAGKPPELCLARECHVASVARYTVHFVLS